MSHCVLLSFTRLVKSSNKTILDQTVDNTGYSCFIIHRSKCINKKLHNRNTITLGISLFHLFIDNGTGSSITIHFAPMIQTLRHSRAWF